MGPLQAAAEVMILRAAMSGSSEDYPQAPVEAPYDDGLDDTHGGAESDGLGRTGEAAVDAQLDGFHQPTAMFDKGQFLGELADLVDGSPDTKAQVEAEVAPPKGFRLIVVAGPDIGAQYAFKARTIEIGRDEDCELPLADIAVSRRHARLKFEDARFLLEDLGSNNGTYLNGERLKGASDLVPGDEIVLGERTLRFVELNEAPATHVALPVAPDLEPDPAEGAGISQIRPIVDPSEVEPEPRVEVEPPPERGRALARVLRWGAVVALLLATVVGGLLAYRQHLADEAEALRQAAIARRFLEAVALVRMERFGDADRVLARLATLDPEHPRLEAYRRHVASELGEWSKLEEARGLAGQRRFAEAIEVLESVKSDSAYADDAARLSESYARSIAEALLADARRALEDGDLDEATRLVARVLERWPGNEEARILADAIAAARRGRRPPPKPETFSIPPILARAVALYREGRIPAAVDAARAAGSPEADAVAADMEATARLLESATAAHVAKRADAILDLVPRALELDRRIGGGIGKVNARLERYFADGLYLRGIVALNGGDLAKARRLFDEALRKAPGHVQAKARLSEIDAKGQALYYQAKVLEGSDEAEAKRVYEKVLEVTEPSNRYHQLAKARLR